jgi:hypothetical protein
LGDRPPDGVKRDLHGEAVGEIGPFV